jgi:hypothetical protein
MEGHETPGMDLSTVVEPGTGTEETEEGVGGQNEDIWNLPFINAHNSIKGKDGGAAGRLRMPTKSKQQVMLSS